MLLHLSKRNECTSPPTHMYKNIYSSFNNNSNDSQTIKITQVSIDIRINKLWYSQRLSTTEQWKEQNTEIYNNMAESHWHMDTENILCHSIYLKFKNGKSDWQ